MKVFKRFAKVLLILLLLVVIAYAVAVGFAGYRMAKTTTMEYRSSSFGVPLTVYELNFETKTAKCFYQSGKGNAIKEETVPLKDGNAFWIKAACSISLFPFWFEEYKIPLSSGNELWEFKRNEGAVEHPTSGGSIYPMGYQFILSCIYAVFP